MKPILKEVAATKDCTTLAFRDISVSTTNLPSLAVLKVSMFDKPSYSNYKLDGSSVPTLTQFLTSTSLVINSFTLGKTIVDDKLIELNCGILQVDYHWIYTTANVVTYVKDTNEVNGTGLVIKDSIYISGEVYTINKSKSKTTKLILNEKLKETGSTIYMYGEYQSFYFINDCSILRGHTKAIGELSVLDCEESNKCLGANDNTQIQKLLKDLMKIQSARIKLDCGDIVNANQVIKSLCNTYAKDCYNANDLLSHCQCKNVVVKDCETCDG